MFCRFMTVAPKPSFKFVAMLCVSKTAIRKSNSNNLLEYAERNWKEGCFNDVILKLENEEIEANRMVLASRSLYFEKLFKTEMKEKYQTTVELHDISGTTVKHLIEFTYTGTISLNSENVLDLLSVADYLQMDEAKQFCFEFLQSIITSDTCFFILSVANLYQNEQLKEKALECITKDLGNVEFSNDLSKNDFINCLSKMKRNQAKESAIYHAIMSWIKYDENIRKKVFHELLFLLDFTKLDANFVEKKMLNEELVTGNLACLKLVTTKLCRASKTEHIKQTESTKVLSIGGYRTRRKVIQVYSSVDEPAIEYPNVPLDSSYQLPFFRRNGRSVLRRSKMSVPKYH